MSNALIEVRRIPGGDAVKIAPLDFDPTAHAVTNSSDARRVAQVMALAAANAWRPVSDPQNAAETYAADAEREAIRKSVRADWLARLGAA